jgi:hypothetical protein
MFIEIIHLLFCIVLCLLYLCNAMKRYPRYKDYILIKLIILAMLTMSSCSHKDSRQKMPSLNGAWTLRSEVYPEGHKYLYPNNGGTTLLRFYEGDSCLYECQWTVSPSGNVIIPSGKAAFTLIYKGSKDVLYLEDGHPRPLTIVDDTTIVIQQMGVRDTWIRNRTLPEKRMEEIKNMIANYRQDSDYNDRFIFSTAEGTLEKKNNVLIYFLTGIVVMLALIGYFAERTYRHKKRLELKLKQIADERINRPEQITVAMRNVEEEFLHSDTYRKLCQRMSAGTALNIDEWQEIDTSLNRVYSGFSGKLFNLFRMSDIEYHVCLLIKLRIPTKDMAAVLCKEVSTISSIRSRLYKKVFGRKGSAKDWDEFILSL